MKKLAIDLDNTIIDYKDVWPIALRKEGYSIDLSEKDQIKEYLKGQEDWPQNWINVQGRCYGELIFHANISKSFIDFLKETTNIEIHIISHKAEKSLCERYNLRDVCKDFLKQKGLFKLTENIHFFETQEEKINWININQYHFCIDDLESILNKVNTPVKIHFVRNKSSQFIRLKSWSKAENLFLSLSNTRSLEKIGSKTFHNESIHFIKDFSMDEDLYEREKFFYDYAKEANSYITPNVSSFHPPYIVTSYLGLEIFNKFNSSCTRKINAFLTEINQIGVNFQASEYILSTDHYKKNIVKKLKSIDSTADKFKNLDKLVNRLLQREGGEYKEPKLSICYPDFYKGNFYIHQDKLAITDFESVGKDDPVRSFLNSIHHYGHQITSIEIRNICNLLARFADNEFEKRSKILMDYSAIEWILNSIQKFEKDQTEELFLNIQYKINYMIEQSEGPETPCWTWQKDKVIFLYN